PAGPAPLFKAFDSVRFAGETIELTRDEYELSVAPQSQLFLQDGVKGWLLKIDSTGSAVLARSLSKLPRELSTPTFDGSGKMLIFAANSDPFPPANADEAE